MPRAKYNFLSSLKHCPRMIYAELKEFAEAAAENFVALSPPGVHVAMNREEKREHENGRDCYGIPINEKNDRFLRRWMNFLVMPRDFAVNRGQRLKAPQLRNRWSGRRKNLLLDNRKNGGTLRLFD